jgi:hypothetical protein
LSRLVGFFGPKDVLLPYAEETLKTKQLDQFFKFDSNDPAEFVKQVGVIQKQLAKMVEYNQDAELATAMGSSWQKFPDSSVQEIRRLEDKMIANFGGRENIKSVLHHIEQSDIHKGFMREMNGKL